MCSYVPPRSEAGRKPPVRKPITLVPPSHGVALCPRKGSAQAGSDSVRGAKRDGKGGGSYRTIVAGPDPAVVGRDDQQRVLPAPRRAQRRREVAADEAIQRSASDERGGRPLLYSHAGVHGPEHVREDRVPELRLVRGGYSLPRRRVNVRRMHALVREVDPEPVCKRSAVRTATAQAERCCTHGCVGLSRVWLRTISIERVV